MRAVLPFLDWCQAFGLTLETMEPTHIAAYIEQIGKKKKAPTVKQHLAAIRMLFDWLVVGQVMPYNPATYLDNGGTIEKAQQIAAHESPRTTQLYDRTSEQVTQVKLDEIEKVII